MGFFKRGKNGKKGESGSNDGGGTSASTDPVIETVLKRGIVSEVLTADTPGGSREEGETPFADVVARRFAPSKRDEGVEPSPDLAEAEPALVEVLEPDDAVSSDQALSGRDHLRAVEPLFTDHPATPELEVDLMAHIGRATTITGNIVSEEDLEIQGTVEGSVRLPNHQVTVGNDGHVKASVEAEIVTVYGKITGDVVASDVVEVEKGGIVGGDIKAPRIIMHDGAIVVGGLDMSAALPSASNGHEPGESSTALTEPVRLTPIARPEPIETDDDDL